MFKIFRKYNKQILVVGGSLLMVIFLIGPAAQILVPRQDPVMGEYADGSSLKSSEVRKSEQELRVIMNLQRASALSEAPSEQFFASEHDSTISLTNLLVQGNLASASELVSFWAQQFRSTGDDKIKAELSADFAAVVDKFPDAESSYTKINFQEIDTAFKSNDNSQIALALENYALALNRAQESRNQLVSTLANSNLIYGQRNDQRWSMLIKYAEMLGVGASAVEARRLATEMMISDSHIRDAGIGTEQSIVIEALISYQRVVGAIVAMVSPSGRPLVDDREFIKVFSIPERRHFMYDRASRAQIEQMEISITAAQRDQVPDQSNNTEDMIALFERFKDKFPNAELPGEFGYKMEDAIRVEVLEIPLEPLLEKVEITELGAWTYYAERESEYFEQYRAQLESEHRLKYLRGQGGGTSPGDSPASTSNRDDTTDTPSTQPTVPSLITTQPTTQPSIPEFVAPEVPTTLEGRRNIYEILRAEIIKDYRKSLALDLQREILRFAQNMIRENQLKVPALAEGRGQDGYYAPIKDTKKLIKFADIQKAIQKEYGLSTFYVNYGERMIPATEANPVEQVETVFTPFSRMSNTNLGISTVEVVLPTGELARVPATVYIKSIRELRETPQQLQEVTESFKQMALTDDALLGMFLRAALSDRFSDVYLSVRELLTMSQQDMQQLGDFLPRELQFAMLLSGYREPYLFMQFGTDIIVEALIRSYRGGGRLVAGLIAAAVEYDNIDLTEMFNEWAVQEHVVGPSAESTKESKLLWRVNEVRPAQAPGSWEEVKTQLVRDLTELKAYEILKQNAERGLYSVSDLKQLQNDQQQPAVQPGLASPFNARSMGGENDMSPVWTAVFTNLSSILSDGIYVEQINEKFTFDSFADLIKQAEQRPFLKRYLTTVTPSEKHLTVFVVHVTEFTPVTDQYYNLAKSDPRLEDRLQNVAGRSIRDVTTFESLKVRTGFEESEDDGSSAQPVGPMRNPGALM